MVGILVTVQKLDQFVLPKAKVFVKMQITFSNVYMTRSKKEFVPKIVTTKRITRYLQLRFLDPKYFFVII